MKYRKRKNSNRPENFFQIIRNENFWEKFTRIGQDRNIINIRMNKAKDVLPRRKSLYSFAEDYKYITGDERNIDEIVLFLVQNKENL